MPRKHAIPSNVYRVHDDEHELVIRSKHIVRIDGSMADTLKKHTWAIHHNNGRLHVRCGQTYAHHLVIGRPKRGQVVRHLNGDSLDIRRANLVITTQSEVQKHSTLTQRNKSGVRGITADRGGWSACVVVDGKRKRKFFVVLDHAKTWLNKHRIHDGLECVDTDEDIVVGNE